MTIEIPLPDLTWFTSIEWWWYLAAYGVVCWLWLGPLAARSYYRNSKHEDREETAFWMWVFSPLVIAAIVVVAFFCLTIGSVIWSDKPKKE